MIPALGFTLEPVPAVPSLKLTLVPIAAMRSQAGLALGAAKRAVEAAGQVARHLARLESRPLCKRVAHRGQDLPADMIVARVRG